MAATGCPIFDFDPLVPDHVRSPWPLLARAREEQPVFYSPELEMWCVTRREDIRRIVLDTDTFRNGGAHGPASPLPEEIRDPPSYLFPRLVGLTISDLPYHTRLRRLMWPHFTPSRVGDREDDIRAIADSLIDGFIDDGRTDLVSNFSNQLPIQAMAAVLGFPPEAAANFRRWTDALFELVGVPDLPHDRVVELWRTLLEFDGQVRAEIQQRRDHPADDLTNDLITAVSEDGSASLTDEEVVANVFQFVTAGTDTTTILIANAVHLLLEDRARWEEVCADPRLVPAALEETLRFRCPIRGMNRVAASDCDIGGVKIPQGSMVYWMPSSANVDESYYNDPDRFDLHREKVADHLAFGAGVPFCIGAPLARLEARVALEQLTTRIPDLHLLPQEIEYVANPLTPSLVRLEVGWGTRARTGSSGE